MIPMQTEMGLTPRTKALLENMPEPAVLVTRYEPHGIRIGCSNFLHKYTSTTEWKTFFSLLELAEELDGAIDENCLFTTLCHLARTGEFEKKAEPGSPMLYRRISRVQQKVVKLKAAKKRKITNATW